MGIKRSESEFAEEESDVWGLFVGLDVWEVSIWGAELSFPLLFQGSSLFNGLDVFFFDVLKVKIVDQKSGWDDVILVDDLDERFDTSSFNEFLFADWSLDCSWVSGNTDQK